MKTEILRKQTMNGHTETLPKHFVLLYHIPSMTTLFVLLNILFFFQPKKMLNVKVSRPWYTPPPPSSSTLWLRIFLNRESIIFKLTFCLILNEFQILIIIFVSVSFRCYVPKGLFWTNAFGSLQNNLMIWYSWLECAESLWKMSVWIISFI